jgi:hypothetical protein
MIESHDPGHYNWVHFFKQSAIALGCNFFVEIHDFIISIVPFGCEGIISFLPTCRCCLGLERQSSSSEKKLLTISTFKHCA